MNIALCKQKYSLTMFLFTLVTHDQMLFWVNSIFVCTTVHVLYTSHPVYRTCLSSLLFLLSS